MMDRLKSMEAFVSAAEAGSFSGAAAPLGISAQMVAKHIHALEDRLGVRLINRTTRRQSLTEFGERYLERCRHILAEAEAADAMAGETLSEPQGRIRVSAPVNFGSGSLMKFLTGYLTRYPLTEVEASLSDRYVNLTEEGFEAVFRVGEPELNMSSSLVVRPLKPYKLIVCASSSYLTRYGEPRSPAELAAHECVGYVSWDRIAKSEWRFTQNGNIFPVEVRSRLMLNDTRAQINAAIGGFGIILQAEDMLQSHIRSGDLVQILEEYNGPSMPLNLIYPADRRQTAKLKTFISEATACFGG